ncbi:hypothetical protein ABE67_14130 [Cytobacillus firmus]|uniref:hypothetical protein n=1 Tax=Cytobacillus firmus TaxID=1399 RepID=UPI0018CFE378|nr:hypothetical protein [Cytobacillus firmus]MBG9450431.1 hypothetical protein [Cytobacillus firmus]
MDKINGTAFERCQSHSHFVINFADGREIKKKDVVGVLKAKPMDDLHRIVHGWYKVKPNKFQRDLRESKPRRKKTSLLGGTKKEQAETK